MATPRKKPEERKKVGRPELYNEELANLVCERTATHTVGLPTLCSMYDDMPSKFTVNLWRYKYPEFSAKYAQAKMVQADLLAEECLEIADETSQDMIINQEGLEACNTEFIARSRLRIDTRKWLAAKLLPRQYGQKAEEEKSDSKAIVEMLIDKLVE